MNFQTASKKDIRDLVEKYNKLKSRTGWDLTTRENNVKELVRKHESLGNVMSKMILAEYLIQEIKPLLEEFDDEDREVIRQYFRFISKAPTINTNKISFV